MNYVGGRGGEAGGGSYTCRKLQRAYRHSPSDVVQCRVRTVILLRKRGKGGEDSEEKGSNGRGGGWGGVLMKRYIEGIAALQISIMSEQGE